MRDAGTLIATRAPALGLSPRLCKPREDRQVRKAPVSFSSPGLSPPWVQPTGVQTHGARSAPELSPGCSLPVPDLAHLLCRKAPQQPPLHLRASRGQFEKRAPSCSCRAHQPPGRTKSGLRGKPSPTTPRKRTSGAEARAARRRRRPEGSEPTLGNNPL